MEIKNINIDDLIPYENNPRKNENAVDKVANSISEFGFKVPIIIDKENIIIAGHTRLKAAQKLGIKEIPCIIANDLTEEQIRAFRIADNKVSELSEWNIDKLNLELEDILNINMSDFGFDFNIDEFEDFDESELDDNRERNKINISIVLENYKDYEIIKERIEELTDEVNGNLSIKMI